MSCFIKHEKNGITYYTSALFDRHFIPHMFAASRGGVSVGDFSSLNVSLSRKNKNGIYDTFENVSENLVRCLDILGKSINGCAMMHQIHSSLVLRASTPFCDDAYAHECDAVFTDQNNGINSLCVKTADCVPILLYELNNNVVCAIHAGWRGTVSDICGNAVRTIRAEYGDCSFVAAIGPHARQCCYEVDDTVFVAAKESFKQNNIKADIYTCFSQPYMSDGKARYKADLSQINKIFLENAGLSSDQIDVSTLCTCCTEDDEGNVFFSHRTSGGFSGTQASVICLR